MEKIYRAYEAGTPNYVHVFREKGGGYMYAYYITGESVFYPNGEGPFGAREITQKQADIIVKNGGRCPLCTSLYGGGRQLAGIADLVDSTNKHAPVIGGRKEGGE